MADVKDYLEQWRELYSYPNYLTKNQYLTDNGSKVLDNNESWSAAQYKLLKGNAIGTPDNNYLDPNPLFNKLGYIYSKIVNSVFISARTDAIKMNVVNMDYTNGNNATYQNIPLYPFFNFYGYELEGDNKPTAEVFYAGENGLNAYYLAKCFLQKSLGGFSIEDSSYDYQLSVNDAKNTITDNGETLYNEILRFNELYELYGDNGGALLDPSLNLTILNLQYNNTETQDNLWKKVLMDENIYYVPGLEMLILYLKFCLNLVSESQGLQLLMPQYKRRVEVEDLNKNFWVISQILDAVVNALWGPYGLVDVVRQLILKVNQIEEYLGLDDVQDIELWHSGSNDMYFDMYSRFTLSGLELKLKGSNGERTLKNIFKAHSETSDRNSTTDGYLEREHLFYSIQVNELPQSNNQLYDSDLISSEGEIKIDNGETAYCSLSSVIDAINDKIVNNQVTFGSYSYKNESDLEVEFFSKIDFNSDGKYSAEELKNIAEDVNIDEGEIISTTQFNKVKKYEEAYQFLIKKWEERETETEISEFFEELNIASKEDIDNLFQKKTILSNMTVDTDPNKVLEICQAQLEKYEGQIADLLNYWDVNANADKYTSTNINELESCFIELIESDTELEDGEALKEQNRNELWNNFKKIETQVNELCLFGYDSDYSEGDTSNKNYLKGVYKKISSSSLLWPTYYDSENQTFGNTLTLWHLGGSDPDESDMPRWLKMVEKMNGTITDEEYTRATKLFQTGLDLSTVSRGTQSTKEAYFDFLIKIRDADKRHESGVLMEEDADEENYAVQMSLVKNWISEATYEDFYIYIGSFNSIGVLPSEDVYVHSFTAAQYLASYLAENEDIENAFDASIKSALKLFNASDYASYPFDNKNSLDSLDVYDCIMMARQYSYENNGGYNHYIKKLIQDLRADTNNLLYDAKKILAPHFRESGTNGDNITVDNIINIFFTLKRAGSSTLLTEFDIYTPTINLLVLIQRLQNVSKLVSGFQITEEDKDELLNSITNTEYRLHDNILLFLYDPDYYDFKTNEEGEAIYSYSYKEGSNEYFINVYKENGLYVKATDGFYRTDQPLIQYSMFFDGTNDGTYALFIPRDDLIGGEIVQLRLTQKGSTKKMLDFEAFNSTTGFNGSDGSGVFKETGSRLFLSLHNCFSTIESQYNHRTTLFFEDIVPEDLDYLTSTISKSTNEKKKLSVDSWFTNGIECQYFRPKKTATNEGLVTNSLQTERVDLKIRASMLSKNDPYNDNSFYTDSVIRYDNKTEYIEGTDNIDDGNINNDFFAFSHELAYCAAQRHNLLFYSSPATNEQDIYIHSPLQLLQTPYTRSDDSIQSPSWSKGKLDRYCFDALSNAGDECGIADIKNMLYKNSKITKYNIPQCIEAIWGSRKVDDYVKKKKLQYIIIEREPGSRNNTYGPTSVGISYGYGYLHETVTSFGEIPHENCIVKWYDQSGAYLDYTSHEGENFPPAAAKYGVIDLTNITTEFANAFLIRFYAGDPKNIGNLKTEFTFDDGEKVRRPIFRMAYFFGVDETGKKIEGSTGSATQYS